MATHSTTTLAAAGGSFGRDERRGADSGDGGDSEHCLADHRSLLVLIGCVLTSAYSVARMIRRVLQRAIREPEIDHLVMAITSPMVRHTARRLWLSEPVSRITQAPLVRDYTFICS